MTSAFDMVLDTIDQSVRPSEDDLKSMAARADSVANALMRSSLRLKCQLLGSVARSTALIGYSDVDLLAIADFRNVMRMDSLRAIAELKGLLLNANFSVETDEFVASVKFEAPPAVDVMPAICRDGGIGYLIPAGHDGAWQEFFPDHLKNLTARSMRRFGPRFASIVRLLKLWNTSRNAGFKSSELEELASIALGGQSQLSSYSEGLTSVLSFGSRWISGNPGVVARMGRPFPDAEHKRHETQIIQDSLAAAYAMQEADNEVEVQCLVKEFFGDEFAKAVR